MSSSSDDGFAATVPPSAVTGGGLAVGAVLAGRFTIERELGRGGMGLVYAARDRVLERPVAVKVLRTEYRANDALVSRFLNEARIVASLFTNPNIVNIYDLGRTDAGDPYLVMEFLRGQTLRDSIVPAAGMMPSRSYVLEIGQQIASALGDAHAAGVVHRDLKPENVFVVRSHMQLVKVLDFGLAVSASAPLAAEHRTRPGDIMGTPQYMSPEAVRGDSVEAPADIYALGMMLYELATNGLLPYDAKTLGQWMRAHELDEARPLPGDPAARGRYPERFGELLAQMLTKTPSGRPTAWDVYRRLGGVVDEIDQSKRT